MATFLHSREGVTQGGPISMEAYGIGILLLIKNLKVVFPDATQTWYAGDAGALGTQEGICKPRGRVVYERDSRIPHPLSLYQIMC